ncbi:MAG TPA: hypothetical protein VJN62_14905 [Gemmatimonadales bacterium]|nr:hypothetical protein [Gemmatimonadales bacterium]
MTSAWSVRGSALAALLLLACKDSTSPPAQNQIVLGAHPAFLLVGDTLTLTATLNDHNGNPIPNPPLTWSSSAPTVLSISAAGLLHGVSQGPAQIMVTAPLAADTVKFDVASTLGQFARAIFNDCATSSTGAGYCRGGNSYGELGNGTTIASNDFVTVAGGHTFREVLPGVDFSCGLTTDSSAWCWGLGSLGSLGTGDTASHTTPVAVAGGHHFAQLTAKGQSACGLTAAGAAYCWGWGQDGQTGDSAGANTMAPQLLPGGLSFGSISASAYSACGVTTGHAGYCWGSNTAGLLGSTTDTVFHSPVALSGGHSFTSVSALGMHCGSATDGTTYCWGNGTLAPAPISGSLHLTEVRSEIVSACGVSVDSLGYCWFDNSPGQFIVAAIPGTPKILHISDGFYHRCAILADSTASCWEQHCGTDYDVICNSPGTLDPIAGGRKYAAIAAGSTTSCGTGVAGLVTCWIFDPAAGINSTPDTVPGRRFTSVSVGDHYDGGFGYYACGIGIADSLGYCWTIGGHDSTVIGTPTVIPGGIQYTALDISESGNTCGVAVGGSVYCWPTISQSPAAVPGATGFVSVASGYLTSCGIRTDASIACWGSNSDGELGLGYASGWSAKPLAVSGGLSFATIETAGDHACGLLTDSTAYCWGSGRRGGLGTGDTVSGPTPRAVSAGLRFGSLSLGYQLSCGLTGDGSAYCWGRGILTPALQQRGTTFTSLAANGYNGMCGLTVAGTALCWDMPPFLAPPRRSRAFARR